MDGKTYPGGGGEEASRLPKRSDLALICAELNRVGAKYLVVGGFAIIEAGFARVTTDIDFLIDITPENEALVFKALRVLPDKAVDQLNPGDVSRHVVVRIADEVLVDLMAKACGVDFAAAAEQIEYRTVEGVSIPFPSPRMLLRMKQTHRDKDIQDRAFLQQLIDASEENTPEPGLLEAIRRFFK